MKSATLYIGSQFNKVARRTLSKSVQAKTMCNQIAIYGIWLIGIITLSHTQVISIYTDLKLIT